MRRLLLLTLVAGAFAGCGSDDGSATGSSDDCGVTTQATKLCGADAATYCHLIDGTQSEDAGTREFCADLSTKYSSR